MVISFRISFLCQAGSTLQIQLPTQHRVAAQRMLDELNSVHSFYKYLQIPSSVPGMRFRDSAVNKIRKNLCPLGADIVSIPLEMPGSIGSCWPGFN